MARLFSNNAVHTELAAPLAIDGDTATVGSTTGWPSPSGGDVAVVAFDYGNQGTVEIATYSGKTATTLTGLDRGLDGTTARAHLAGVRVWHVASAADIQRALANTPTIRHKTAFTARASTTTLAADPDLTMPVTAGDIWFVHGTLDLSTDSATPDAIVRFAGPTGTSVLGAAYVSEANATTVTTKDGPGPHFVPMAAFSTGKVDFFVRVLVGSTSGTFSVQWAQNTLDATEVRMTTSSFFVAHKA